MVRGSDERQEEWWKPDWSLHDFGDPVRFTIARCREDEPDLALAGMDFDLHAALVDGHLDGAGSLLTAAEVSMLPRPRAS